MEKFFISKILNRHDLSKQHNYFYTLPSPVNVIPLFLI